VVGSAPDRDDALFPSGEWLGFYVQSGCRWRQELALAFADGGLHGSGGDGIGAFAIRGRYDRSSLEVVWQKHYLGAHTVDYRGFREGKGIWGTWELAGQRGGFQIWPRRAAAATTAGTAQDAMPACEPVRYFRLAPAFSAALPVRRV